MAGIFGLYQFACAMKLDKLGMIFLHALLSFCTNKALHGGINNARTDSNGSDIGFLHRERIGNVIDGGLGSALGYQYPQLRLTCMVSYYYYYLRAISTPSFVSLESSARRHNDDGSLGFAKMRQGNLHKCDDGEDVDIKEPLPAFKRSVSNRCNGFQHTNT